MELKRYGIMAGGISKTYYRRSGNFTTNSVIFCSRNEESSVNGVVIIVDKCFNHLMIGYKPRNSRIIAIIEAIVINFIQVNAPNSAALDKEIEFYNKLGGTRRIAAFEISAHNNVLANTHLMHARLTK